LVPKIRIKYLSPYPFCFYWQGRLAAEKRIFIIIIVYIYI